MYKGLTPSPDPGFVRKLKTFDPKLKCKFSRKLGKFVITQPTRLRSGEAIAAVVESGWQGSYRQPDDRDLAILARADFERKSHKARIREGEEFAHRRQEAEEKFEHDEILARTREDHRQLQHYYANLKGDRADEHNPAFRRIEHKSKGYTVSDKRRVA